MVSSDDIVFQAPVVAAGTRCRHFRLIAENVLEFQI
jgi:hypothetical protein